MKTLVQNKGAYHDFTVLDKYVAGIQLMGTEVKSIKDLKASISEAYIYISNNEVFLKGMHVSDYKQIKYTNHQPLRDRKLLLKKAEIKKLILLKKKGLNVIPLSIMLSENGFIKIQIATAKPKKTYDKRLTLKLRDLNRELKTPLA